MPSWRYLSPSPEYTEPTVEVVGDTAARLERLTELQTLLASPRHLPSPTRLVANSMATDPYSSGKQHARLTEHLEKYWAKMHAHHERLELEAESARNLEARLRATELFDDHEIKMALLVAASHHDGSQGQLDAAYSLYDVFSHVDDEGWIRDHLLNGLIEVHTDTHGTLLAAEGLFACRD